MFLYCNIQCLYLKKYINNKIFSQRFIGEESVADGAKCNLTDLPTWIVDPIDGTTNFVHRLSNACIFCTYKTTIHNTNLHNLIKTYTLYIINAYLPDQPSNLDK